MLLRRIRSRSNHPPNAALRALGVVALLALVVGVIAPVVAGAAPAARQSSLAVLDDFEGPIWPTSLWYLPPDTAPMWWTSSCRAASGAKSLRAFGGPGAQGEVPCAYRPPAGSVSTVYLELDLRNTTLASRLELYFQLWLKMPASTDGGLFIYVLMPQEDGSTRRVPVFGATGDGGAWAYPPRQLDLMALVDITNPGTVYDLRGGRWRLEWSAVAPAGMPADGGIYIDDVTLLWEPDAAVPTPTTRPTLTSTPTASATPTATITPSPRPASPTATASPSPSRRRCSSGRCTCPTTAMSSCHPPPQRPRRRRR